MKKLPFPLVKVSSFKTPSFCVDGRAGKVNGEIYGPYPQMLGASLMPAVLEWLISKPEEDFSKVIEDVFNRLKEFGYSLGVHTSTHAIEGRSDCGFADNLKTILSTFREKTEEIKGVLTKVDVNFSDEIWQKIREILGKVNLKSLPTGKELIGQAESLGAVKQVLEGEHQEVVAVVNLASGKTLDVDKNQEHQAFNLDLWLVREMADKFGWDQNLTDALSLGLYVATEMVLVEGKGKSRLPILINQ
ncbi:MAG: cadmium-containing carbonic anhydrase [Patescibacteria group bacterium]|nr:cadmium-containing carbonic anhydrase [Patescibacteria group bacterium]